MKTNSHTCTNNRQKAGRGQLWSPLQDADPTGSRDGTFGVQLAVLFGELRTYGRWGLAAGIGLEVAQSSPTAPLTVGSLLLSQPRWE